MNLKNETQTLPPPPGIIGSLRIGFDTVAAHITAIIFPLAVDLLLWLGPHISVNQLIQPVLAEFQSFASGSGISASDIKGAMDTYTQFFQQFNLLGVLRTFPIGVPSLMSGEMPIGSPLGASMTLQVNSFGHLFGLLFLFTICGWIFGGLYFRWIASLIAAQFICRDRTSDLADRSLFVPLVSNCMDDRHPHWFAFIYPLRHQFIARRRRSVGSGIPVHVVDRADFLFVVWDLPSQTECVHFFPEQHSVDAFCFADQQFICLDHVLDRRWVEFLMDYSCQQLVARSGRHPRTRFYHDGLTGIVVRLLSGYYRVVADCV